MLFMLLLFFCSASSCLFNDTATTEIYTYGHTLSLLDALPILVDLRRAAVIPDPVRRQEIIVDVIGEGVFAIDAGAADQRVGDGDRRTGDNIGRDAAILVDLVIVADQADRQRIARFEQQLPAHAPTVAVVDVLTQVKVAGIDRKSTRLNSSH